jgi:hypothetical protein
MLTPFLPTLFHHTAKLDHAANATAIYASMTSYGGWLRRQVDAMVPK